MDKIFLLAGYTGVGKSHFLSEAQKYGVSSLHLRRMWEEKYDNSRELATKAFLELEKKNGNRNEWLNILLPEIKNKIKRHKVFIIEGISVESEIDWIYKNFQGKEIRLIYIYTNFFEKRCESVAQRENTDLDNAKKIIHRSDTNRTNLGMPKIIERADMRIENKYDESLLVEIREILMMEI